MADKRGALFGKLVVVTGGTGFVGTHVAQALLQRGARLRVVGRHPKRAYRLKALANLGQIQFVAADITRSADLAAIVTGADAVVNCVGAFAGDLEALHVRAPAALARAAQAAGAQAFVHISANATHADSAVAYSRTKAEGEAAVRAAFPQATVLRPSVMFGGDDKFLNMFGKLIEALPVLPVFGPGAQLQPVFVDDVAEAVAEALSDPKAHGGRTYELVGPEVVTMAQLNTRIAEAQGRKRLFAPLPDTLSGLIASATGWLPFAPLSADQWALLKAGNVGSGAPGLKALGITPRPLDLFLARWMTRYRSHGRFADKRELA